MQETEDAIPIVEFSRGILEWTEEKKTLMEITTVQNLWK